MFSKKQKPSCAALSDAPAHASSFKADTSAASVHAMGKPQATSLGAQNVQILPDDIFDADAGQRLNKAVAASGHCSRRKADDLIQAGRVRVNNLLEINPARHVLPSDVLSVDNIQLAAAPLEFSYFLLHKPVGVVCTVRDPENRPTVMEYLPPTAHDLRLYPVGRLDFFSEGLLLLTNDGDLAQALTHPARHQVKKYEVLVRGFVPDTALNIMRDGMRLAEGEELRPIEVDRRETAHKNSRLRMTLHQGVNRQIRRMCRDLDLTILRLRRVAQGSLTLGDLASGQCRSLTAAEAAALRKSAGL